MNPLLRRIRTTTTPAGQIIGFSVVTHKFDGSSSGGGLAVLNTGCRAWGMLADIEKYAAIRRLADSQGVAASIQTATNIQMVIDLIARQCAAIHRPTIADVGMPCEAWAPLTHADKLGRVRGIYGASMGVWTNEYDVAGSVAEIDAACVRAGVVGTNTILEVTVTAPPTGLPADLAVSLDGIPMTRMPAPAGQLGTLGFIPTTFATQTATFQAHGMAAGTRRVSVRGANILPIDQNVDIVAGTTTSVPLLVHAAPASVRVAVSVPVGVSMSDVAVTGIPGLVRGTDGTFSATGVPPLTIPYDVVASAPGMEQQHQSVLIRPGDNASLSFSLRPSASSVSVVVALAGTPAPGAPVPTPVVRVNGTAATRTSPDGPFVVTGIAPGSYTIDASADGYDSATQTLAVTAGASASARFDLRPSTGRMKVVFSALSGGLPAMVSIAGDTGGALQVPSNMPYSLAGIAVGSHTVTVTADGFQPFSQSVAVAAGQETRVQADLQPLVSTVQPETAGTSTGTGTGTGTSTGTGATGGTRPELYELCPAPPIFTEQAARAAWMTRYAACPAPPPVVAAAKVPMSRNAKLGVALGVVAVAGIATYFVTRKRGR